MTVNLVAVQAGMALEHYQSADAFAVKVLELTEEACAGLPPHPTLVAFPEAIGFPLLLTLGRYRESAASPGVMVDVLRLARREWRALVREGVSRGVGPLMALYRLRAAEAYRAYRQAFSSAASQFGVTLVAGSIFLPECDEEISRGLHFGRCAFNTAYTFAPTGAVLGRTHKCHLTRGLESRVGLATGRVDVLTPCETPVGKVGVAICLDGFHQAVLERFDGLGARVVVQPSANFAPWYGRWPVDPALEEGEAWFRYGLRRLIQDRLNLRYGLNPMLVGELWDLRAEGRSSVVVNTRFGEAACEGYRGVVALARTHDQEEVVRATVALD
jgi:predicted amidohydrolase